MIRSTSGSAHASRKSRAPARSASSGPAAASAAPAAIRLVISASTCSATAANRPALSRNWWYRAPRVTPAALTISSVPTSAYPRAPNNLRAARTSAWRVASERSSCLLFVNACATFLQYVLSVCKLHTDSLYSTRLAPGGAMHHVELSHGTLYYRESGAG